MNIGICDQTQSKVSRTEQFLCANLNTRDVRFKAYLPEEVAIDIEENIFTCDIFITEIVFSDCEYDGLCLAKAVQRAKPDCRIIFFVDRVPDCWDIYEVEHSWLVFKGSREANLIKAVSFTIDRFRRTCKDYIKINYDGKVNVFYKDEVYMVKKDDRLTKFYTVRGVFLEYLSLKELERQLPSSFVRVNGNCIVNNDYIVQWDRDNVVLRNNETVKIGRSYKGRFPKTGGI